MSEELIRFIDHARDRGLDLGTIRQLLVSAGWQEKEIAEVFCARELEMPIPGPPRIAAPRGKAKRRQGSVWPRRARDASEACLFIWP